jgi:hypothetical protein
MWTIELNSTYLTTSRISLGALTEKGEHEEKVWQIIFVLCISSPATARIDPDIFHLICKSIKVLKNVEMYERLELAFGAVNPV